MSTLTLCLVIHNHQPVGDLAHVFAEATEKAYEPMLDTLTRHPGVRLTIHYTGPLLDWLGARRPDHLDQLGDLVAREQVELLTGIYFFHIRVANFAHLIAAEELADREAGQVPTWARVKRGDLDADGQEEVVLNTDQQVLIFKPSCGGTLVEWDWRHRRYNLLNTMTRRAPRPLPRPWNDSRGLLPDTLRRTGRLRPPAIPCQSRREERGCDVDPGTRRHRLGGCGRLPRPNRKDFRAGGRGSVAT